MTAPELREHAGYVGDKIKIEAYRSALAALAPGQVVLDLGTGSGLLGLLAAQAGATHVYAVDSGAILGVVREVVTANATTSIDLIRGASTKIDLPQRASLAVCDQIGGLVYDAGVLHYFADARKRLLTDDAVLIPSNFRLFVAPATCQSVRDQIALWRSGPAGFDFSAFATAAVNTEHRISGGACAVLGTPVCVGAVEADHIDPILGEGVSTIAEQGQFDGIVGWFEADMGGGAMLTNEPGSPQRFHRWCNFYPIDEAVVLDAGDRVHVSVDIRPLSYIATWKITITKASGPKLRMERHSTLLGQFMDTEELHQNTSEPVHPSPVGKAVARGIVATGTGRSVDDVLAELRERSTDLEWTKEFETEVRAALRKFTSPNSQPVTTKSVPAP